MYIFNGLKFATQREESLKKVIQDDGLLTKLKIGAVLFNEDIGSSIYTNLKQEMAQRVGIQYQVYRFSLVQTDEVRVIKKIIALNLDPSVTGIIIQKPTRKSWLKMRDKVSSIDTKKEYAEWWGRLTTKVVEDKDVDGLHPDTLKAIQQNTWQEDSRVLPATCRAVLSILDRVGELKIKPNYLDKVIIIGKSDLLGQPLYYQLLNLGVSVELIATKELKARMLTGQKLLDASTIITATGKPNLVTTDMISDGAVVIDVGEPKGDVDKLVKEKASFITPVPGGVGPVTVVSLLENCVLLYGKSKIS